MTDDDPRVPDEAGHDLSNPSTEVEKVGEVRRAGDAAVVPIEALANVFRESMLRSQPQRTKTYARPFIATEEVLRRLDTRVRELLPLKGSDAVVTDITASYADLSGESFRTWEDCFNEAGEAADVESLSARWEQVSDRGEIYRVSIELVTEMPLESGRDLGPIPEAAHIQIDTTGPTRRWTRDLISSIGPLIDSTKLPLLLRPLERFRSDLYRQIGSYVLGIALWFLSFRLLSHVMGDRYERRHLQEILSKGTLDERFETFVRTFYGPRTPFFVAFLVFLIPYGLLFGGQVVAHRYLGRLVPRSAISIGLSAKRYTEYMNVFRFLMFTVLVGGVLGLVVNAVWSVIQIIAR